MSIEYSIDVQDFPKEIREFLEGLVSPWWDFPPDWMQIEGKTFSNPEDECDKWEDFSVIIKVGWDRETDLSFENYEDGWALTISDSSEEKLSSSSADVMAYWQMMFNMRESV